VRDSREAESRKVREEPPFAEVGVLDLYFCLGQDTDLSK
jgi:hypothetical protein